MALKRPGSASNLTFFITAFWTLVMVIVLVAGHLVLGFLLYGKITGSGGGMEEIANFTAQPAWLLWLSVVAALALDGWIIYHHRKMRKEALRR